MKNWRRENTTYILMVHVFEHPQLPVGPLGVDGGLEWSGYFLDGHPHVSAICPLH